MNEAKIWKRQSISNIVQDIYNLGQAEIKTDNLLMADFNGRLAENANILRSYVDKYTELSSRKNLPKYEKELYQSTLVLANNLYEKATR